MEVAVEDQDRFDAFKEKASDLGLLVPPSSPVPRFYFHFPEGRLVTKADVESVKALLRFSSDRTIWFCDNLFGFFLRLTAEAEVLKNENQVLWSYLFSGPTRITLASWLKENGASVEELRRGYELTCRKLDERELAEMSPAAVKETRELISEIWTRERWDYEAISGEYNRAVELMVEAAATMIPDEGIKRIAQLYRRYLPIAEAERKGLQRHGYGYGADELPSAEATAVLWTARVYEQESGRIYTPEQVPPGFADEDVHFGVDEEEDLEDEYPQDDWAD